METKTYSEHLPILTSIKRKLTDDTYCSHFNFCFVLTVAIKRLQSGSEFIG